MSWPVVSPSGSSDAPDLTPIIDPLLAWWDAGHAAWPWRLSRDPYHIWVAEVMLQQTQIAAVLPYYERWLSQFPTVAELAAAPMAQVLKVWEGLGYYSRARHLHAAAQQIVVKWGGRLPGTVAELLTLPGIGRYTAGAIASIAFNQPAPIVDGNITRVLTRLADLPDDISRSATRQRLWRWAAELVPPHRPGDFNQALMELGQRLCLPTAPKCPACPLRDQCRAQARGVQLQRPVRPPRRQTPHYHVAAGVIWRADGLLLIAQRPLDGLLGGLWEFPGGKQEPGESLPQTLRREIKEELALEIDVGPHLLTLKHAYTHFRITLHAFEAHCMGGQVAHLGVADHAWVRVDELDRYAFAATDRHIVRFLQSRPALPG